VARRWLSIRVELIEGGGWTLWPRPGRVFAAARSHTFAALADAIDTAFARSDRAHLCLFAASHARVTAPSRAGVDGRQPAAIRSCRPDEWRCNIVDIVPASVARPLAESRRSGPSIAQVDDGVRTRNGQTR
jgi:hypothetical protein